MRLFWISVPKPLEEAIRACRWHFFTAACFSALINILYLAPTIYMMQIYDRVVPTGGVVTLFWITVLVGVAIATLTSLDGIRARLMTRASLRVNRLLSGAILDRLMSRSKLKTGEPSTAQAMREFDVLRQTLGGPAATALFDAPWTPLYFVVAFVIHPVLGLLVLAGGAILVGLALTNEKRNKAKASQALSASAAAYASQEAAIGKAEVIRSLGMRKGIVARQMHDRRAGLEASADVQFSGSRYNALVKFFRMFMQSLALGVGAWLAVRGQISVGAIIAASVLLSRALQPIEQLVAAWPSVVQSRIALQTLDRLFERSEGSDRQRTALPPPEGHLHLDRIIARSPDGASMLLKNVSLRLVPGEVLGVVGPSGAGKSTLARVAVGALPPDLGEIRIDGASIEDWDPELLAQYVGYLPQDGALLPGTIGDNISRFAAGNGVPRVIIDKEVVEAARSAGIHDMVLQLPSGYDTVIGPDRHLSAGQAQRVALARALYGNPKVLILDEPNSALDTEGEEALARAVAAAKIRKAAIMIISHRTAILANAERLLVLRDGAVSQYGPRQEVVAELRAKAARPNVVPMKERV